MKLHLPHSLRNAVLACLSAVAGLSATVASGALLGGACTMVLALAPQTAAEVTTEENGIIEVSGTQNAPQSGLITGSDPLTFKGVKVVDDTSGNAKIYDALQHNGTIDDRALTIQWMRLTLNLDEGEYTLNKGITVSTPKEDGDGYANFETEKHSEFVVTNGSLNINSNITLESASSADSHAGIFADEGSNVTISGAISGITGGRLAAKGGTLDDEGKEVKKGGTLTIASGSTGTIDRMEAGDERGTCGTINIASSDLDVKSLTVYKDSMVVLESDSCVDIYSTLTDSETTDSEGAFHIDLLNASIVLENNAQLNYLTKEKVAQETRTSITVDSMSLKGLKDSTIICDCNPANYNADMDAKAYAHNAGDFLFRNVDVCFLAGTGEVTFTNQMEGGV